jgi:ParB family chromosome partitioning protein
MEKRLGRGLGSLLSVPPPTKESKAELPIAQIRPNPFQPRRVFAPQALEELEASIREHGVLQPVVVRSVAGGFELIAGERRWRASKSVGLASIPAVVRDGVSDEAMLELALVENLQRADLDAIEKAKGFHQLLERGHTQEQVATKVGLQRSSVANFLRLLELSEGVQKVVQEGLISMGHARALLGLGDRRRQEEVCALVVRKGLSVRDLENRVRELQGRTAEPVKTVTPVAPPWQREMESRMRTHLGTKVQVRNGEGYRGQIVIDYHGREDLDRLYALLAPKKTL